MHQLSLPPAIDRAQTPEALFAAVRADDAARALVTFYDDSSGERMELSAASLGNWVAKTHFLLTDELGLGPGDRAFVALPLHWQRLVVWLGAWSAGLELVNRPDDARVAFVTSDRAVEAENVDDVFALALAPWGRGFEGPASGSAPIGTQDFVVAVRPQADAWGSVRSTGGPGDLAIDGMTRAEMVAAARRLATEFDLGVGARIGIDESSPYASRPEAILAALSVAGSVVLTRSPSSIRTSPPGGPSRRRSPTGSEPDPDRCPTKRAIRDPAGAQIDLRIRWPDG